MSCRSSLSFIGTPFPEYGPEPGAHEGDGGCQAGAVEPQPEVPFDQSCAPSAELTAFLLSLGATPEQIAEAAAGPGLVSLGPDLVFAAAEGFTAGDVAARAGATVDQVMGIWLALGVEVPDPDTPMFSAGDVELVR